MAALFLMLVAIYYRSPDNEPRPDPTWTVHVALSLARDGDINLNEYPYAWNRNPVTEGQLLYGFPIGTALLSTPIVALIDQFWLHFRAFDFHQHLITTPDWALVARVHLFVASILTALAAIFIYLIGRLSLSRPQALLLSFIFALCTSAWSTASRDLWQHTASLLMLSIALYLVLLALTKPAIIQYAALPLAFSFVVRPTNVIPIILISFYVLITYRQYILRYLFWATMVAAPYFALNLSLYDHLLTPYYRPQRLGTNIHLVEALLGNLISPSRGLFIYTPVVLLVFYGIAYKIRRHQFGLLDACFIAILGCHWVMISSFKHWWGGAAFGPRFFTDILPFMMYFLIPVIASLALSHNKFRWMGIELFAALIAISLFIHYRGALETATWDWNMAFANVVKSVDDNPARLWDWSDVQFLRGMRPASISIQPEALCITWREGEGAPGPLSLLVANQGDQPVTWQVETMRRVTHEPFANSIPALGYGEAFLSVDPARLGVGLHSMGGVYVDARTSTGLSAQHSPAVAPITLQILPSDPAIGTPGHHPEAAQDCSVFPQDILLNGKPQDTAQTGIQALYGSGWYDQEISGEVKWRWSASPATLYIFSPRKQKIEVSATPLVLHDSSSPNGQGDRGILTLTASDGISTDIPVQVGQSFSGVTGVKQGWNRITLALQAGNYRPIDVDAATGDTRELSFALGPLNITSDQTPVR